MWDPSVFLGAEHWAVLQPGHHDYMEGGPNVQRQAMLDNLFDQISVMYVDLWGDKMSMYVKSYLLA